MPDPTKQELIEKFQQAKDEHTKLKEHRDSLQADFNAFASGDLEELTAKGQQLNFEDRKQRLLDKTAGYNELADKLSRQADAHRGSSDPLDALLALMEEILAMFFGKMRAKIEAAKTDQDLNAISPGSVMREVVSEKLDAALQVDKMGPLKDIMKLPRVAAMAPAGLLGGTFDLLGDGINAVIKHRNADIEAHKTKLEEKGKDVEGARRSERGAFGDLKRAYQAARNEGATEQDLGVTAEEARELGSSSPAP